MLDRKHVPLVSSLLVATAIAGCITVHVYFPVKELKEAADEIVEDVRPDIVGAEDSTSESDGEDRSGREDAGDQRAERLKRSGEHVRALSTGPALLSVSLISTVWADESDSDGEKEESERVINASSPKIRKIKASLKARYRKLLPLYTAGRVGEGLGGLPGRSRGEGSRT